MNSISIFDNVKLWRLREEHLETVRVWRNSDHVRKNMDYQAIITPEEQVKWFRNLRQDSDFYYIILEMNRPVGVIHASQIDADKRTGNSGLFIGEKESIGTFTPYLASHSLLQAFMIWKRIEQFEAKVQHENTVATQYNKELGFTFSHPIPGKSFSIYTLTRTSYKECWNKNFPLLEKLMCPETTIDGVAIRFK